MSSEYSKASDSFPTPSAFSKKCSCLKVGMGLIGIIILSSVIICLVICFVHINEINPDIGCICLTCLLGVIVICLLIVLFLCSKHTIIMKNIEVELKKIEKEYEYRMKEVEIMSKTDEKDVTASHAPSGKGGSTSDEQR